MKVQEAADPTDIPPVRCIVYIDGFNLYFGIDKAKLNRFLWLDVVAFARSLCLPTQELVATKYFTSRISAALPGDAPWQAKKRNEKHRRQDVYLQALATLNGLEIIEGQFYSNRETCSRCNGVWMAQQEKMTDVNIATALLVDAHYDRYDTAIVVSADSDLSPPVRAVPQMYPKKRVVVYFPPGRSSNQMRKAASAILHVSQVHLKHQLPEIVQVNGGEVRRPEKWK